MNQVCLALNPMPLHHHILYFPLDRERSRGLSVTISSMCVGGWTLNAGRET